MNYLPWLTFFTVILFVHSHPLQNIQLNHRRTDTVPPNLCRIELNNKETFPEPQPLLLNSNLNQNNPFVYPNNNNGDIDLKLGEKIMVACPGKKNYLKSPIEWRRDQQKIITCSNNNMFTDGERKFHFKNVICKEYPFHEGFYTGKMCENNNSEVVIGFYVNKKFLLHNTICFDNNLMTTLYSHFNMTPAVKGSQHKFARPLFMEGIFFKNFSGNVNRQYTKTEQIKTFAFLLQSDELAAKYIHSNDDFFLARGHLTAKADFVFGAQQRSTFYYINAAPQWQIFNDGNWKFLEMSVRKLSGDRNYELDVYTGTYNVSTLPSITGEQVPIYLWAYNNERALPVPKYYWKVVHYRKLSQGVAFIGLNNPYVFNIETDVFCKDICDKINWVSWDQKNITKGYSFCCDVNEFRNTVKYLPKFNVNYLLV